VSSKNSTGNNGTNRKVGTKGKVGKTGTF